ncbi:MAG TPA: APC family permease [Phenylobacterium sp.]|nr:APC family permease [Phenylobacterium sp.]
MARQSLSRGMGVMGALFLTLSAETPASSVFVILPGVVQAAGSGALIAMAAAGVVALCMALTYAELGSTFPSAGGEYAIVGTVLGPLAGFAVLGVNLMNLLLGCAVLSLGVADYLGAVWPGVSPLGAALGALAIATGLGVLNIRASALVTGAFLAVELAALALVTGLGAAHPVRPLSALIAHPAVLAASGHGLQAVGLGGIATGVVVGLFAYDGYGSAVYLAEEVTDVRRRLVRAVLWALAVTAVTELAALSAVLAGAPDLAGLLAAGDNMISDFATHAGGPILGRAISAGVALAILNAVIALVLITGRQIYATARDGVWPGAAGRALSAIHPRTGAPWVATLASGALSAGLCLVPMKLLLLLSGSSVTLIYIALACACLLHGPRRAAAPGWKLPLWPAPPLLALVLLVVFAASSLKDGAVSFAVSLACAAAAALYYRLVLKPRDGWGLSGPSVEAP